MRRRAALAEQATLVPETGVALPPSGPGPTILRVAPGQCPKCDKHIGRTVRWHALQCNGNGIETPDNVIALSSVRQSIAEGERQKQGEIQQTNDPAVQEARLAPGTCPKCHVHIGRGMRGHALECDGAPPTKEVAPSASPTRVRARPKVKPARRRLKVKG